MQQSSRLTGTLIHYYLFCKRRCYLHAHNIKYEDDSDLVKIGKFLHEQREKQLTAGRKDRTELLVESIKIDSIEGDYVVEYKKKNSTTEAAKAQLLYYLYTLKQKGVIKKGLLKFKESKVNIQVHLTKESEAFIERIIGETEVLIRSNHVPSTINKPVCKNCAYYEYCYS